MMFVSLCSDERYWTKFTNEINVASYIKLHVKNFGISYYNSYNSLIYTVENIKTFSVQKYFDFKNQVILDCAMRVSGKNHA